MNTDRIKECTTLSAEILKNFELSELPVSSIILKCLRLCRLLGDDTGFQLFTYESSGYPDSPNGLTALAWQIAQLAGRRYYKITIDKDGNKTSTEYADSTLVSELEASIDVLKIRLSAAADPSISLTSANPNQLIPMPYGNSNERERIVLKLQNNEGVLQKVKSSLYGYILQIYNRLSYGNIIEDTFTIARLQTNEKLGQLCPESLRKFVAVYNNIDSDNPEDWANAVHSCRRILMDLADALYPPQNESITVNGIRIKVGKEQYINRLIQFIESRKSSDTYAAVVGADLSSIGERIQAVYNAACKGTHSNVTKDEASRYIIHTYFLISDIVALI